MSEKHCELIEDCQADLSCAIVGSQCLEELMEHLVKKDEYGNCGLTERNRIKIRYLPGSWKGEDQTDYADKVRTFLEIIIAREEYAANRFIKAIVDTNQIGLIEMLNSKLPPDQRIRNDKSTLAASTSASTSSADYTFNNKNNQGRMVGGPVHGGIVVFGDYHASSEETRQSPSTPSSTPPQLSAKDWQQKLENAQQSLKKAYLTRFKKVHPFSLPFTLDTENTWVSLALKDDLRNSQSAEDHAELLETAFEKAKMLIIEGDSATGKTSLMRRLAYEWAKGKQELSHFDLIVYVEFPEVCEQTCESIVDLVFEYSKNHIEYGETKNLKSLLSNRNYCERQKFLLLLDGYDESSLDKPCTELSTYLSSSTLENPLLFNIVLTTRLECLSRFHGQRGRYVFAEVLGFITDEQKKKYISNHFATINNSAVHIAAVHRLLNDYQKLKDLADTPLFLMFICLVHEKIIDGTLVGLCSNIIWWLINRYQQDFPDRDIPALFGFQNGSDDKFETIQEHYLHFPQLHCLGKMALHNLGRSVFKLSDCAQFNLEPVIEQVGLLRKNTKYDQSVTLAISYFFPHRTIQEFFAAFYCFCSDNPTNEWLLPDSKLNSSKNEFERFLLRIALSDKMPIQTAKREYYFKRITIIDLDTKFDAFNTTADFNNNLLNWFFSQCINTQRIELSEKPNVRRVRYKLTGPYVPDKSAVISSMSSPILFSFSDSMKLHSVTLSYCKFEAKCQLSFSNCPSLKTLHFNECKMNCSAVLGIITSTAIETVEFLKCTFEANSHLSFKNCPSLKILQFNICEMKSSTIIDIATLPPTATVGFATRKPDMATWQSITDAIRNSSVKCLKTSFDWDFNEEFLIQLQKCNNVEKMKVTISSYCNNRRNELVSFSHLIKLHSMTFQNCTLDANSQLSFTNCQSLKNLKFRECRIESNTNLGIATLSAVNTMEFSNCNTDLATWQSITDAIRESPAKCLKLRFTYEFNKEYLIHLQKCKNVEKMEITIWNYKIRQNDLNSFRDLTKLHSIILEECKFEASSQLSFKNCPSLKNLKFYQCEMESSTNLGFATLSAINAVEFYRCKIDLAAWQAIMYDLGHSCVRCLKLNFGEDFNIEFLIHLPKCNNVEKMEITIYSNCDIRPDHLLSFRDLINLHSLTFLSRIFIKTSQMSFSNCPSLKKLQFKKCEMKSSTIVGIATLPAINTVEINECDIDLVTWQSILNEISSSSVSCLQLSADYFAKETYPVFLHHLQKCERIQEIHVKDNWNSDNHDYILYRYEVEVTKNLAQAAQKLSGLRIIILDTDDRRLEGKNKERIEKAGQERNPDFLIKYVDKASPELED